MKTTSQFDIFLTDFVVKQELNFPLNLRINGRNMLLNILCEYLV